MLTLKAPEDLVAELEALARERGLTRHAAALEAIAAGVAALRARGDTRGDTGGDTEVIPPRAKGDTQGDTSEALADLVAERVVARLAGAGLPARRSVVRADKPAAATEEAPESQSGRAPGQPPRRPGDYRIGGRRKTDPPEGSPAALLLTWRRARGLSQKDAAALFDVERKTWQRWETGERYPEAAVVERVKAEVMVP